MAQASKQSLTATIADLKADVAGLDGKLKEALEANDALLKTSAKRIDEEKARVSKAKIVIAGLREEIAELKGYIRRSQEVEDATAPLVQIDQQTPVMAPRTSIRRSQFDVNAGTVLERPEGRGRPGYDYANRHAEPIAAKHWTEI